MTSPPGTVPELLRRRATTVPQREALVVDGVGSLSFGTWEERANACARGLRARGVAHGDRIALVFDNTNLLDYAVTYMGVLKVGAVAVPLAPRFSTPEMIGIVEHCGAAAVVSARDRFDAGVGLDAWPSTTPELEQGQSTEAVEQAGLAHDLAEILYTSRTTGAAKGVACSHETLLFDLGSAR